MKKRNALSIACVALSFAALSVFAPRPGLTQIDYNFDAGSTGSDGALDVSGPVVLPMPADGIFNFTTVTVQSGGELRFDRNPLNTPVFILATGDIDIQTGGLVDVSGEDSILGDGTTIAPGAEGGPGGFRGGNSAALGRTAGYGHGPGGSSVNGSGTYLPELCLPLVGGSGGAGWNNVSGSGGGGAILLASDTRVTIDGAIDASAGDPAGGWPGSGGAVRVVAPVIAGGGTVSAFRARADAIDVSGWSVFPHDPGAGRSVGSYMVPMLPAPEPSLDITALGADPVTGPVSVTVPFGGTAPASVTVQASNFSGTSLDVRLSLIPDNDGAPTNYDATLTDAAGWVAVIPVTFPENMRTSVMVWTR